MYYDKLNAKLTPLQREIDRLRFENAKLKSEADSIREILDNTLHEVRRFSAEISRFTERLSRETESDAALNQTALSAFNSAGLMASRLAYTDIELNPRAIENQTPVRSGIYKKFDKAKKTLAEAAREKRISVLSEGASYVEIEALPVFELLPFVILDNAIKYSPPEQNVVVQFDMAKGKQSVTVKSIGPFATPEEVPKLFEKGFRGSRVGELPGQGLGLYLAKKVCDIHGIKIRAESGPGILYQLGRNDYATFKILMQFP